MGKTKHTAEMPDPAEIRARKRMLKKNRSQKWRHVVGNQNAGVAAAAQERKVVMNGKRRPEMENPRRKRPNGHAPGMFVRVNNQAATDDDSEDSEESEVPPACPPQKRRKREVLIGPPAPEPPQEPPKNVPMYKIIRNGQVHRIPVDPDRPGPSKEYEPLNSLAKSQANLEDLTDEDYTEDDSEEELSEEEEFEDNFSDEVETGDSEHELNEELLRRMHHGHHYDSDDSEEEYMSDETENSEFRSDFDTDEEEEYYRRFMHENESDDTDYDPGDDYIEDLYIPKGTAKTYSLDVTSLPFSPDDTETRVIDVTEYFEQVRAKTGVDSDVDDDEDDSSPEVNGDASSSASSSPQQKSILLVESSTSSEENESSSSSEDESPEASTVEDYKIFDIGKQRQVLLLKRTIFINGILDVQLLAGHAQINGYELKKNVKKRIVSAKGYKYSNITPIAVTASQNGAIDDDFLKDYPDVEQIRKDFDSHRHALLLLSKSKQTAGLKLVQKYTQRHLFPAHTKFFTEPQCKRPLIQPEQWNEVEIHEDESRTLIVGGKNVGKTTFIEHLLNKSLQKRDKILLVDLDIGQPVLLMPQVVSAVVVKEPILGTGIFDFEHLDEGKAFLFGDINVMLSPVRYLRCVKELIKYCVEHFSDIPWVINTMGFQKGLGLELMVCLIKLLQPTNVVQIQHEIENFNYKNLMNPDFINNFTFNMFSEEIKETQKECKFQLQILESVLKSDGKQFEGSLSPVEKRTIMILAQLGPILTDHHEWFTDVRPMVCSRKDITIKVIEPTHLRDSTTPALINGNLVYLCHHSSNDCDIAECLGLGIVRAINSTEIFLLPTTRSEICMQKVNTLVVANINLPSDVILRQSTKVVEKIPYIYNTENEFVGSKKVNRCVDRHCKAKQ